MTRGSLKYLGLLPLSLSLVAACMAPAMAGGFGVEVELPKADDARMTDAMLVVRPVGCMGPGATVSARAEGIVDGKRRSVPLKLELIARGTEKDPFDTYALRRQWSADGVWVLAITAEQKSVFKGKTDTLFANALVEMGPNGRPRMDGDKIAARHTGGKLKGEEILAALQMAARHRTPTARSRLS